MAKKLPHYTWQYKLQDILRKRGITQKAFCERIGMWETELSMKINGYNRFTLQEALRVARELEMPVEEIFVMEGE